MKAGVKYSAYAYPCLCLSRLPAIPSHNDITIDDTDCLSGRTTDSGREGKERTPIYFLLRRTTERILILSPGERLNEERSEEGEEDRMHSSLIHPPQPSLSLLLPKSL